MDVVARAVIYVSDPARQHTETRRCLIHCEVNHYQLVGVIVDHDGNRWRDAFAALANDIADVLVVAAGVAQTPRLEVAGDRGRIVSMSQRRPRRI